MAGLPADRLQVAPAFSKVGVDFFGPLKVKHLRKQEKRYGCLFTCLVTREVHLEVAHSLSTDSFIMSLLRFIAKVNRLLYTLTMVRILLGRIAKYKSVLIGGIKTRLQARWVKNEFIGHSTLLQHPTWGEYGNVWWDPARKPLTLFCRIKFWRMRCC